MLEIYRYYKIIKTKNYKKSNIFIAHYIISLQTTLYQAELILLFRVIKFKISFKN